MKITVNSVMLILSPREKLKKPKFTSTVENPTLSALKKKFFTGPLGKMPAKRYDDAEPIIPPIKTPAIILANLLLAMLLLPSAIDNTGLVEQLGR